MVLAHAAPPAEPPAHLRASLMAAARGTTQKLPTRPPQRAPEALPSPVERSAGRRLSRRSSRWTVLALVAAVAIVFAGALWALAEVSRLRTGYDQLAEQVEAQNTALTVLQTEGAQVFRLPTAVNGQETGANALVVWSPVARQGMLMARQFPPLEADKAFQAWVTRGDQITSLGLFHISMSGSGYLALPPELLDAPFDALGITMEPSSGSPRPTSKPVVRLEVAN